MPVGHYLITENANLSTVAQVQARYGGTRVQLEAGRFLEAAPIGAGSNKDAGLPNITGYFTGTLNGNNGGNGVHLGAFIFIAQVLIAITGAAIKVGITHLQKDSMHPV